jgi:uncharacterized membrane protein
VPIIKFLVADGWQITGQTIFANGGYTLQKAITRTHGMESPLARALGNDIKGKILARIVYRGDRLLALVSPWISVALYTLVALIWLIPDRRIEHALRQV